MSTFQRARSEEQRETRRQAILLTAAAMLTEMPVSQLSLNELSRRVGLAKSNVLRYFESREAVLLELLTVQARAYLTDVVVPLPAGVDLDEPAEKRVKSVAAALAMGFAHRAVLCDLLSVQAGVLEHNVSVEAAARYKGGARDALTWFGSLLQACLPELGAPVAREAATTIVILVGALWTHAHPAPAVVDAYASDPTLIVLPGDPETVLSRSIRAVLHGFLVD